VGSDAWMNRRSFIAAVSTGLISSPLVSRAQRPAGVRRIGWLFDDAAGAEDEISKAYPDHLRTFGWIEGKNLIVERRYTGGRTDRLKALSEELVGLKVELIVAEGTLAGLAVKSTTSTLPIVVARSADPVLTGLVASLASPGTNVTGTSTMAPDLYRKRVQLLRDLLPAARRIGLLLTVNPIHRLERNAYEQAHREHGMQPIFIEVSQPEQVEPAVDELARQGAQALRVGPDPFLFANFQSILKASRRHSLPLIVEERSLLEAGGLMSYGPDDADLNRQVASIIDKILGGTKPADIPVRQPTKFELLINLKTARAFGITVPPALLQRADGLIQ